VTLPKSTHYNKGVTHFTIVKILRTFSPDEMNEFEKMLDSPFFNNHSTILRLYRELKKYYPLFTDKKLSKEHLFSAANRGISYDDQLLRKYLSRITKLAEEYLNILQMRKEEYKKDYNVLLQLSSRNIKEIYTRKIKEVEKRFDNFQHIETEHILHKHFFSALKYVLLNKDNQIKPHNELLVDSINNLLDYFLIVSGWLLNEIESHGYTFDTGSKKNAVLVPIDRNMIVEFIENAMSNLHYDDKDRMMFLEMVLNDMKMSSSESGFTAYTNLKKLVFSNSHKMSPQILQFYLQRMNVYCLLENLKGTHDMHLDLFQNYRKLLEENLFVSEGKTNLRFLEFRGILISALKIKEFEWAEKFIKENVKHVDEDLQANVFHYGYSILRFYTQDYSESLSHNSKIQSTLLPITIDSYILKAKNFYMLEHFDSGLSLADSFRHYVNLNKLISDFHKQNLFNFLKYFRAVIRLKAKINKQKAQKLLAELETSSNVREKKWLVEMAKDLLTLK
jgi:hypothetical protein